MNKNPLKEATTKAAILTSQMAVSPAFYCAGRSEQSDLEANATTTSVAAAVAPPR